MDATRLLIGLTALSILSFSACSDDDTTSPDTSPKTGTVTDVDGNVYETVKIGDQWWMKENLGTTRYRNGDPITKVTDGAAWEALTTEAYCEYDNDPSTVADYGRYYNWYAVDDSRGLAPEGWHVPTDADWKQLEMHLGLSQAEADAAGSRGTDEGGMLKEAGTAHWLAPNTGATNESRFTALPGGYRVIYGDFLNMGYDALIWTATEMNGNVSWYRSLGHDDATIYRDDYTKKGGLSVRCVKD